MPEYLLSVHIASDSTTEPRTDEQMREFMRKVGELEKEMEAAGALMSSGRLDAVESAKVARTDAGETLITDGPFVETKEHLGGFYIVSSENIDEALTWAAKTSACINQPIEVRPFVGLSQTG